MKAQHQFSEARSKKKFLWAAAIFTLLLVAVIFLFFQTSSVADSVTEENDATPIVLSENKTIQAQVADTPSERIQGLSGRDTLDEGAGMLFVFENPGDHGIWMKEMNFSLDIIWLDENYRIVSIVPSVSPDTYPRVFQPEAQASYVLEVNAGVAAQAGLQIGDRLQISLENAE